MPTLTQCRRLWMPSLGLCLAAVASTSATGQLPDVGGAVGGAVQDAGQAVPNVNQAVPNATQAVPNVNQTLPNVRSSTRSNTNVNVPSINAPNVNVRTPNVNVPNVRTPKVENSLNQSGTVGATVNAALAPNHFRSPEASSRFLGASVPVSLDGVMDASRLGMAVDTRQNRLRVASVASNSVGATAGLRAGDEIVAVNRTWIRSFDGFNKELSTAMRDQNRAAWILVNREGRQQWVNLNSPTSAAGSVDAAAGVHADGSASAHSSVRSTAKPVGPAPAPRR